MEIKKREKRAAAQAFSFTCFPAQSDGFPERRTTKSKTTMTLPAKTISESYTLEYGTNTLDIHLDAIQKGQQVLVADDLLATGGTAAATCRLVEQLGGEVVGLAFVVELLFLKGIEALSQYDVFSVIKFD